LCKSREEPSHHLDVKAVGAVEHHALDGQRLGEILRGLGFSCTSRSLGTTTEVQVEGTGEGHVALVGEGCDYESRAISEIFVGILETSICLPREDIRSLLLLLPVVSQSACPIKVVDAVYPDLDESAHNLSGVYIDYNQGTHCVPLELVEVASHQGDHSSDLLI